MAIVSELQAWQDRLARHFAELHDQRRNNVTALPVFGLEHGLDSSQLVSLELAIKDHIATNPPASHHALPWIVYSSELGYRYSGDEYWQTFERETPGWRLHGSRYWMRDRYRRFNKEFGGAEPSGLWAEHFSIICWPITHAILPKDLQRQLAKTLYDLRYRFSKENLASPSLLGDLIASYSWNTTSRFQNFAQEKELLGQIAAALLLHEEPDTGRLLHPATLMRISQDLERERVMRGWLRGARQSAKESLTVRGLAVPGLGAKAAGPSNLDAARRDIVALGIEPRLVLRPGDPDGTHWQVSLEIPDLSGLLYRFPDQRSVLTNSRCTVAGAAGRPLARGRCLHGPQQVRLKRWPRADEVLLRFEQTDDQLEFLLRTECLLRPGPKWLFRIATDGLGYECRTLRVRPDEKYILASTDEPADSGSQASSINLGCEGIHCRILDLPPALNLEWQEELQRLGLQQASTIRVWPAGLDAVAWDGEGHGEWLASERPCLAILADHALASISLAIDGDQTSSLEIGALEPGEPVFVELPHLTIGVHRIKVSARRSVEGGIEWPGDLEIAIRIRTARQWAPGTNPHSAFRVQLDPELPSLEEFWEGRVEVSICGPSKRKVNCRIAMFERDDERPSFAEQIKPIPLPVSNEKWRSCLEHQIRKPRRAQEAYDTARFCRLEFDADELGAFTVQFEREFSPLRWAMKGSRAERTVRLLDDSGKSEDPEVLFLSFDKPCKEEARPSKSEYPVPPSGGMYVARQDGSTAALIVPPSQVRGLRELGCVPVVQPLPRSVASITRIVSAASTWGQARLPGDPLSRLRQQSVLRALVQDVFHLVCGEQWATAERDSLHQGRPQLEALSRAVSRHSAEARVGADLLKHAEALSKETHEARIRHLASLATTCCRLSLAPQHSSVQGSTAHSQPRPDSPEWLCELALRLASDPAFVESWAGQSFSKGLARLLELPTVARAARFLVIAVDSSLPPQGSGELYASWSWS